MKSKCGRFEYHPEIGIKDSISHIYVSLEGVIQQKTGFREVKFSESTKKIISEFIEELKPHIEQLDKENKQRRLKDNFFHEFNKNLSEGYL